MKLRCILIDDEPDALDALRIMIVDFLGSKAEVVGVAASVKTGKELIASLAPDVVFTDVEMPDDGGFAIAEAFPNRTFKLIFVTAYDQYAIRALKMKAEDYLLKPVDHEELEKVIISLHAGLISAQPPLKVKISTKNSMLFIDPADIIYIKGDGRYSEIFLKDSNNYVVTKNIGLFESELPNNNFLRVHKSYLVNVAFIKKLLPEYKIVLSNGSHIEISRRKKQELKSRLSRFSG